MTRERFRTMCGRGIKVSLFSDEPLPQHWGGSESYHSPRSQCDSVSRNWMVSFTGGPVLYAEFSESADKDILTGDQGLPDQIQDHFEQFVGSVFGKTTSLADALHDVGFGKAHDSLRF